MRASPERRRTCSVTIASSQSAVARPLVKPPVQPVGTKAYLSRMIAPPPE